jgi:hypothetical protein
MLSYFYKFLHYVSHSIRHTILEYAYPAPKSIRIFAGEEGSLHNSIVTDLVNSCAFEHLTLVDCPERSRPTLWIDDEFAVSGCMTVCRYLGRQWRLLPINPTTCATVDSSLELLQSFMYPFIADTFDENKLTMCDHIAIFATILEDSFVYGETDHLNGFETDTLADVCWSAAWKHVMDMEGITLRISEYPNLHEWMIYQGVFEEEEEGEEDGGEKGEEEGENDNKKDE